MKSLPTDAAYIMTAAFLILGVVMHFWRAGPNFGIGMRVPWTFS